jgi:hypothetical protein
MLSYSALEKRTTNEPLMKVKPTSVRYNERALEAMRITE